MAAFLDVLIFVVIVVAWVTLRRRRWALSGLISAGMMWFFSTFGAYLWNLSRRAGGSGVPAKLVADASWAAPGTRALLFASVGSLAGVGVMACLERLRRKHGAPDKLVAVDETSSRLRQSFGVIGTGWLSAVSGVLYVAWALGQGPSMWWRDSYLAADGVGMLLTATATPAPLFGATALAASLISGPKRETRLTFATAAVLGTLWWVSTMAVGTRLAVTFPLAVLVALVVRLVRRRPTWRALLGYAALIYVIVYLVIFSFTITLSVRHITHGLWLLPELLASDGLPNLFWPPSWAPIILRMVSSVASSYVITNYSALHPAPAKILWMNANPLPQAIAGVDAYTYERMMPYDWVPLSMAGEWYGVYGPVGQIALFAVIALVGALSAEYLSSRTHGFLVALAVVLTVFTVAISIQYPSRWFWRLLSISVALPVGYGLAAWALRSVRAFGAHPKHRRSLADS